MTATRAPGAPALLHGLPASAAQRWFLTESVEGLNNWHLMVALRVHARFEREPLAAALHELVARHEALRTTLRQSGERLEQLIWDRRPLPVHEHAIERPEDVDALLLRLIEERITLDGGELTRADVLVTGAEEHVVAFRIHHALVDGYACGLVAAELTALYGACLSGRRASLEPVAVQAREHMAREELPPNAAARAYWRGHLVPRAPGAVAAIPLRPPLPSTSQGVELPELPADAVRDLAQLGATLRAPLPLALLATVASVFHANGAADLRVCFVHGGRYRPEYAGVVGALAGLLPLRIDLDGDDLTYRALLARVHRAWIGAIAHRAPIDEILRALDPAAAARPFWELEFNFQLDDAQPAGDDAAAADAHGIRIEPVMPPFSERATLIPRDTCEPYAGYLCGMQPSGAVQVVTAFVTREIGAAERAVAARLDLRAALPRVTGEPDRRLRELLR